MKEMVLKNGTVVRPYHFQFKGYRMTVWARNPKEALKRAERLWGKGLCIPQESPQ